MRAAGLPAEAGRLWLVSRASTLEGGPPAPRARGTKRSTERSPSLTPSHLRGSTCGSTVRLLIATRLLLSAPLLLPTPPSQLERGAFVLTCGASATASEVSVMASNALGTAELASSEPACSRRSSPAYAPYALPSISRRLLIRGTGSDCGACVRGVARGATSRYRAMCCPRPVAKAAEDAAKALPEPEMQRPPPPPCAAAPGPWAEEVFPMEALLDPVAAW